MNNNFYCNITNINQPSKYDAVIGWEDINTGAVCK